MFLRPFENSRYMQYVASLTATLSMTCSASYLSWPSPTLPMLFSDDSPIGVKITSEEGSWVVSVVLLMALPFTFISGWMLDRVGRKNSLLLAAVPLAIPWIIIVFAKSALTLCIARSLAGFGLAIATIGCPMYTGEISDSDIRGRLTSTFVIMRMMGSIVVLSIGPFISYTALALVCLSLPVFFVAIFWYMPESPYYLIKKGRFEEAKSVVARILPNLHDKESLEMKIKEIKKTVEDDMRNKSTMKELFTSVEYRRSILVMAGLKTLQQFSGHTAIEPYMQIIVESSNSGISPEVSSIIFGFVQLVSVLVAGTFVDKLGRKPLMIVSALGCALALISEGIYFYMQDVLHSELGFLNWLPTTGLVVFLFMNSLGVNSLPYVFIGELFATNIKGQAMSAATFYGGLLGFLLSKFFQPFSNSVGIYTTFWLFSCVCIIGSLFVYFLVPETKGKSFADIQTKLKRNLHQQDHHQNGISIIGA